MRNDRIYNGAFSEILGTPIYAGQASKKINFIDRLIIRKISKVNKTVHRILWDAIDDFVGVIQNS
jgi:hypothetical protein